MLLGPVISRECALVARRARFYFARAALVAALFVLVSTAWQVVTGTQLVRGLGELARFGGLVFPLVASLDLVICTFIAALSTALSVAQEKDRRTLPLLLLTDLSSAELVLGELASGIVGGLVLVLATLPLLLLLSLLGGISPVQIAHVLVVATAGVLAGGSLGVTVAFWREKTTQTLALVTLVLVLWTTGWETLARSSHDDTPGALDHRLLATVFSPWHAMAEATRPLSTGSISSRYSLPCSPIVMHVLATLAGCLVLTGTSIVRLRSWALSQDEPRRNREPAADELPRDKVHGLAASSKSHRHVWANPVLWRETRTWAYGRRVVSVRVVFWIAAALAAWALHDLHPERVEFSRWDAALPLSPLAVLALLLINAQAVTAITSERDAQALDLLRITDLEPRELIFGKLGGIFYNTKELILLPPALATWLACGGGVGAENLIYLLGGWSVLCAFAAVLGIHAGMAYSSSRVGIAISLGTMCFLLLGVATSMRVIVAFSGSFSLQLQPFLVSMLGGFAGLYLALGARNPSPAIALASLLCPAATLYALTSFLLGYTLAVFLAIAVAFAFTAAALLVPALDEFDVATSRPVHDDE